MGQRDDIRYYGTILAICAPAAVAVWILFHSVYTSLSQAAEAVGYVEPSSQMAIFFSYLMMVGGTAALALGAAWAALRMTRAWLGRRER